MAERDDDTAVGGDELLREAERLRMGPPLPDPTEVHRTFVPVDLEDRPAPRHRLRDPGALLVGTWFTLAGVVAALLGEGALDDLPPVIVPISFAVVGLGLLLPKRRRDR